MRTVFKHCWFGTRLCAGGLWRFLRWSLWLALVGLIGLQLWLASAHELPLPAPLLRHLERHIGRLGGESPLIVHIGRAAIDPQGRILVEDISVGGPGIEEPLLTLRLLHVRLDPWTLLQGEGLVHEVELAGLNLFIPGALSASGKAEPFLRDVAADFQPAHSALTIERLAGQCDDIAFSVQGAVSLASFPHRSRSTPATDWYPAYLRTLRKIAQWSAQLAPISGGKLTVRLVPEATSGANAHLEFLAEGLSLSKVARRLESAGVIPAADFVRAASDPAILREFGIPGKTAHAARRFGLSAVDKVPALKNWFMAEARGESGATPRLLHGEMA